MLSLQADRPSLRRAPTPIDVVVALSRHAKSNVAAFCSDDNRERERKIDVLNKDNRTVVSTSVMYLCM